MNRSKQSDSRIPGGARHSPRSRSRRHSVASDRITPRRVGSLILRVLRFSCWLAGGLGIVCGLYMTLRPSSILSEIPWLPRGVASWADSYGRFRNFPAYAILAVPFMIVCNGRRARFRAFRWLALFGAAVEAAQYFIPTRWCEWEDVAWSWAGLLATWILAELIYKSAWQIRCAFKKRANPDRVARVLNAVLPRLSETEKS